MANSGWSDSPVNATGRSTRGARGRGRPRRDTREDAPALEPEAEVEAPETETNEAPASVSSLAWALDIASKALRTAYLEDAEEVDPNDAMAALIEIQGALIAELRRNA